MPLQAVSPSGCRGIEAMKVFVVCPDPVSYTHLTAGRGTFVRTAHVEKQAGSSTSFTDDMASNGLEAGARLVSYRVLRARDVPEVAEHLQADENELIHHFVRLRTANGRPIAIGYTYIRSSVIPAIDIESLDGPFYSYVRSLGIEIRPAEQVRICAALPTAEQLELLEASDIAPVSYTHLDRHVVVAHAADMQLLDLRGHPAPLVALVTRLVCLDLLAVAQVGEQALVLALRCV